MIPKIIWTAYPSFETARDALELTEEGGPLAARFVDKTDGFPALLDAAEKVFEQKVRINASLDLPSETELCDILGQIKAYRKLPKSDIAALSEELGDLLRKLFTDAKRLKVESLTPGAGGSGVVRVQPVLSGEVEGEYVVVKFGRRDNIRKEVGNYTRYVQPYAGRFATNLVGEPAETLRLGAARFSFHGHKGTPRSFNDFYGEAQAQQAQAILSFVFQTACRRWCQGKLDWRGRELDYRPVEFDAGMLRERDDALAASFELQKGLSTQQTRLEVRESLSQVFEGGVVHRSHFRRVDDTQFEVTFSDPPQRAICLPDPLAFAETQRHTFPQPGYWSITHGDLHGGNIMLDEDEHHAWLIDFFKTSWGPALRDFSQIETSIRVELTDADDNLYALSQLEQACLKPRGFDEPIDFDDAYQIDGQEKGKTVRVIEHLRKLAMQVAETEDMKEYYVGLLYHTLKLINWHSSSVPHKAFKVRQRHAVISAGLICDRLQRWDEPHWRVFE